LHIQFGQLFDAAQDFGQETKCCVNAGFLRSDDLFRGEDRSSLNSIEVKRLMSKSQMNQIASYSDGVAKAGAVQQYPFYGEWADVNDRFDGSAARENISERRAGIRRDRIIGEYPRTISGSSEWHR
jgi:hypothetical protein